MVDGDQTFGEAISATDTRPLKRLWEQMQMKSWTGAYDECVHCGHPYYEHAFKTHSGAISCAICSEEMNTPQCVCYIGEGSDVLTERAFEPVKVIWFWRDGYAFRFRGLSTILVNVENPFDPATDFQGWAKFELFINGQTCDAYFASGGELEDLKDAIENCWVDVEGDDTGCGKMTKSKFNNFYTRWIRSGASEDIYPPPSAFKAES